MYRKLGFRPLIRADRGVGATGRCNAKCMGEVCGFKPWCGRWGGGADYDKEGWRILSELIGVEAAEPEAEEKKRNKKKRREGQEMTGVGSVLRTVCS